MGNDQIKEEKKGWGTHSQRERKEKQFFFSFDRLLTRK
jgi:hypothetical protein